LDHRVAIPIPGAAEIPGRFDDSEVPDPRLAQPNRHEEAAEAATDDHDFGFFFHRCSDEARLHVGVEIVMLLLADHVAILRRAVRAQPLVAFPSVLFTRGLEDSVHVEEISSAGSRRLHCDRLRRLFVIVLEPPSLRQIPKKEALESVDRDAFCVGRFRSGHDSFDVG
jgi:hypothetical protein